MDAEKNPNDDPLTFCSIFVQRLIHTIESQGETVVLQYCVDQPKLIKNIQRAYSWVLSHEVLDIPKLSAEELVGYECKGLEKSTLIRLHLPPTQHHGWYYDLAENIPEAYIALLLKRSHPFYDFESDLVDIEAGKLCSTEIVRRSVERPEIVNVLIYKSATSERKAKKYLRERPLNERIQLAKRYGLKTLRQMEIEIANALNRLGEIYEEKYGWKARLYEFPKLAYKVTKGFPSFEKELWAELIEKSHIPSKWGKYLDHEFEYLVRCVAIDYSAPIKNNPERKALMLRIIQKKTLEK